MRDESIRVSEQFLFRLLKDSKFEEMLERLDRAVKKFRELGMTVVVPVEYEEEEEEEHPEVAPGTRDDTAFAKGSGGASYG